MRYVLLFLMMGLIAGCGRKPAGLSPPDPTALNLYPQVYPKPLPGDVTPAIPDSDLAKKYRATPEQSVQ